MAREDLGEESKRRLSKREEGEREHTDWVSASLAVTICWPFPMYSFTNMLLLSNKEPLWVKQRFDRGLGYTTKKNEGIGGL